MSEREQVKAILDQVEESVNTINGPGKEELKATLAKWKRSKKPSLEDVKEWNTKAQMWIASNVKKEVSTTLLQQGILFAVIYVVSMVVYPDILNDYLIALPFILQVQGEQDPSGVGQYVVLESRDTLDALIRSLLLMFPVIGISSIVKNKSMRFGIGLGVGTLVVMESMGKYIMNYLTNMVSQWLESLLDDFERGYLLYAYGVQTIHIPIAVSLLGILIVMLVNVGLANLNHSS